MIPRFKPDIGWREIAAAMTLPRPDDIERFENEFSLKMGQKHAVAFPYGRTGLMLLLEAMGLKDQEIICPAYTCVVVPHAIVASGNIPIFIDSQADDYNMDLELVRKSINKKTGAIVATSLFGYPIDLNELDKIRSDYPHIKIIQDCAHSFAAEWKGRAVQKEGSAAVFGLNISKLITSVFGGIVTTDDHELALKLKELRKKRTSPASIRKSIKRFLYLIAVSIAFKEIIYGLVNILERSGLIDRFTKYYDPGKIDMPYDYLMGLSKMEARVGIVQLKKYDNIVTRRRKIAVYYNKNLGNIHQLILPKIVEGATYSHYVVRVSNPNIYIINYLRAGIQLGRLIEYNIPEMPAYGSRNQKEYPNSSRFARTVINLPNYSTKITAKIAKQLVCTVEGNVVN